jgi:hypothetical protein
MNEEQKHEYCGAIGEQLLIDLAPLTAQEYSILVNAVRVIERTRLEETLSQKDAEAILALLDDYAAFEAAARS